MTISRNGPGRRIPLAASLLLVLAAFAPLSVPLPLSAPRVEAQGSATSPWDAWVGTYRNLARDGGAAVIAGAVDTSISPMGPVIERIARRRILANYPAFQALRIERSGAGLTVDFVGARRYSAPLDGSRANNRAPDGSDLRVSFRLQNGRLLERMEAGEGSSVNIYRLSEDGSTLGLRSTMESDRLPAPITFALRFRRQP